jgi:dihydroflavonol-4-reductase
MRILVTGASGFIGGHLVAELARRREHVSCLVRAPSRAGRLTGLPVDLVHGDLDDLASLRRAVEGATQVYHLGGATKALRAIDYYRTNAAGTARLLAACAGARVPPLRVVLVSSLAACGPSPIGRALTEEDPPRPVTPYGRSKLVAETVARMYADRFPLTVVRPPIVYGPADREAVALFRLVNLGVRPVPGDGQLSLIHIDDLVAGLLLAGQDQVPSGRTYFLAGLEQPTFDELGRLVAAALGRRTVGVRVPYPVTQLSALMAELLARLRGRPSVFDRAKASEVHQSGWRCRADRAHEELGFSPRVDLAVGLRETVSWYRTRGWL